MNRRRIHFQIHNYLLMITALVFPVFIKWVPIFLALLFLNWLAEWKFREKFSSVKNRKIFFLFTSLYLLYLTGLFYTNNFSYAGFDLQVKLSLLLCPIVFATTQVLDRNTFKRVLLLFALGCILSSLMCVAGVLQHYFNSGEIRMFYRDLSGEIHPTYRAMNHSLAMLILLYMSSGDGITNLKKAILYSGVFFLWIMILFLQSKAGILVTGLVFIVYFSLLFFKSNKRGLAVFGLLSSFLIYYLVMEYVVTVNNSRVSGAENVILERRVDKTERESNQIRIVVWQATLQVIKENILIGTGTGDIKDELLKVYVKNGMTGAYKYDEERKEYNAVLNSHNQFLQTFATLGIPGFLSLVLGILIPFLSAWKNENPLYLYFLIIVGVNFLFESALEVQAGTMFFAFFNSLLFYNNGKNGSRD